MIILPDTPPCPLLVNVESLQLNIDLKTSRSLICDSKIDSHSEIVRYVISLEDYLEEILKFAVERHKSTEKRDISRFLENQVIFVGSELLWSGILLPRGRQTSVKKDKLVRILGKSKSPIEWTLYNEFQMTVLAISFVYSRLGSELTNELVEGEESNDKDSENEKWKQVVNYYRRAISILIFWKDFSDSGFSFQIGQLMFTFLEKVNLVNIQMSVLSKFASFNKKTFDQSETFSTYNNGTLCKVAIGARDEITNCQKILKSLLDEDTNLRFEYIKWLKYLNIIEKYVTAYAGLFFSIEKYQQDKLGEAIGLVNFSLLSLQSKNLDVNEKINHHSLYSKIKTKAKNFKNELFIKNLESVTTLDIDNSVFNDSSGVIIKDLAYLFDQLVILHLKFTKENDNLKFDKVSIWKDINNDSKWPLGSSVPRSTIPSYHSRVLDPKKSDNFHSSSLNVF